MHSVRNDCQEMEIFRHAQIHNANRRLAGGVRPGGLRRKQQLAHNLGDNLSSGGGTSVTNADTTDDDDQSTSPGASQSVCEGNTVCEGFEREIAAAMDPDALPEIWARVTSTDYGTENPGPLLTALQKLRDARADALSMTSGMANPMTDPMDREAGCGDDAACKRVEQKLLDAKEMGAKELMDAWEKAKSSDDFAATPNNLKTALAKLHAQLAADLVMTDPMTDPMIDPMEMGEWAARNAFLMKFEPGTETATIAVSPGAAGVLRNKTSASSLANAMGTATYNGAVNVMGKKTGMVTGTDYRNDDLSIQLVADFDTDMITADLLRYMPGQDVDVSVNPWGTGEPAKTSINSEGVFSSYTPEEIGFDGAFYDDDNEGPYQFVHGSVATDQIYGTYGAEKPPPSQ